MKFTSTKIAVLGILALWAVSANAVLIDHGTYTTDTQTGLDWLDITATANRSYNEISQLFDSGEEFQGFRYASVNDFITLVANAGATPEPWSSRLQFSEIGDLSGADELVTLLTGPVEPADPSSSAPPVATAGGGVRSVRGLLADVIMWRNGPSPFRMSASIVDDDRWGPGFGDTADTMAGGWLDGTADIGIGSYLVKISTPAPTIPEPSTMVLLGLGMLGLGYARKQKKPQS